MTERRLSRRALLVGLGAAASAAAGCTTPSKSRTATQTAVESGGPDESALSLSGDDAWTTYGYEPGHTGFNPDAAAVGSDASQVWEASVEGIYTLREPAVADGRLF